MEKTNIRLECLKLAHSLGRESAEVIGRAKAYEEYILSPVGDELAPKEAVTHKVQRPRKNTGNPDILS